MDLKDLKQQYKELYKKYMNEENDEKEKELLHDLELILNEYAELTGLWGDDLFNSIMESDFD